MKGRDSPKACQANSKVAGSNAILDIPRLGEENDEGCDETALGSKNEGVSPGILVGKDCKHVGRDGAHSIWRNRHQLRVGRSVSHALENAGHSELHGVVGHSVGPVGEKEEPNLVVKENILKDCPVEMAVVILVVSWHGGTAAELAKLEVSDLVGVEPSCRQGRRVAEEEDAHDGDYNGE